jgi:hypothetical protein
MIDFFDRLYTSISNKNKILEKIRYNSALRFILRLFVNIIVPIYFLLTRHNKQYALNGCIKSEGRIIVSLTSFPARIGRIWLVVETILRQTQKPDKIILWLSKEQFHSFDSLPKRLMKQRDRGLEIRIMKGDICSHKKYYYTLQEFPNDYLLTVDDDIFYRSTMVEDMFNRSQSCSMSVISQYSRKMIWTEDKITSYSLWPIIEEETSPNLFSFFGSGGGTLFPPLAMDSDVLNLKLLVSLTPTADDVWLNAMCRLKRTTTTKTSYYTNRLPVLFFSGGSLESINNRMNQNDVQILAVREHYIKIRGVDPFNKFSEQL